MWMGKKNFFSQVREIVLIHVEATFDGPIGYPPLALDQCQDLLQQLVKIHDASSPHAYRTGMLTEGWSSYEHTVALRASSIKVHSTGQQTSLLQPCKNKRLHFRPANPFLDTRRMISHSRPQLTLWNGVSQPFII
jgi:hypothetical protein